MHPPGSTLGILGGGHLSRMVALAAQALGYRVHVFDPQVGCPAGAVANREHNANYEDAVALTTFAGSCDVVTYEFEDVPSERLDKIGAVVPLRPSVDVLRVCQNRQREKQWLKANGFPHVDYVEALDGDVAAAVAAIGRPALVKTADLSFDGKGQMKLATDEDLEHASAIFRGRRCVVEKWCDLAGEIAVIVARGVTGETRVFPVAENIHANFILDFSLVPARIAPAITSAAQQMALGMAERLDVTGLLAVEFFVTKAGELLVNELAPRPHNSGHWSLDGCETNQFEQHVRAVCGLPLGDVAVKEPTVMVNVLGEAWQPAGESAREPNWAAVLGAPRAKLHLYGKAEARAGRKMGHFTVRDADIETALGRAREIRARL